MDGNTHTVKGVRPQGKGGADLSRGLSWQNQIVKSSQGFIRYLANRFPSFWLIQWCRKDFQTMSNAKSNNYLMTLSSSFYSLFLPLWARFPLFSLHLDFNNEQSCGTTESQISTPFLLTDYDYWRSSKWGFWFNLWHVQCLFVCQLMFWDFYKVFPRGRWDIGVGTHRNTWDFCISSTNVPFALHSSFNFEHSTSERAIRLLHIGHWC